ncbi:hypothetical protein MMC14_008859 [Varicellaria rhodocarpa]|nr:hypothetical protein [Varicellaria rhodocarpa]
MIPSISLTIFLLLSLSLLTFTTAQSSTSSSTDAAYIGYSLTSTGDPDSAVYDTASTPANVSTTVPEPDVYLNASIHVGEIDLTVSNLTAKINLDAQVLQLLKFNAGVDASIDRVSLLIQNMSANVVLEARLENLVLMIGDILDSLDLNPVLATLGQDVGNIVNTTVGGLTGSTSGSSSTAPTTTGGLSARSFKLANNILYSINDYSGHTHTNRVLTQRGSIVDELLDNSGDTYKQTSVGDYASDMTFNGYSKDGVVFNGQSVRELEYTYSPYNGLSVVSAIYVDADEKVVGTQVLSESSAGGE